MAKQRSTKSERWINPTGSKDMSWCMCCSFCKIRAIERKPESKDKVQVPLLFYWFSCWNDWCVTGYMLEQFSRSYWLIPPSTQIIYLLCYCNTLCSLHHPVGFKIISKLVCPLVGNLLSIWHPGMQLQWMMIFCIYVKSGLHKFSKS